jgi:hypothetical protein
MVCDSIVSLCGRAWCHITFGAVTRPFVLRESEALASAARLLFCRLKLCCCRAGCTISLHVRFDLIRCSRRAGTHNQTGRFTPCCRCKACGRHTLGWMQPLECLQGLHQVQLWQGKTMYCPMSLHKQVVACYHPVLHVCCHTV